MAEKKIAILGAGRIGEALLSGLLSSGWRTRDEIVVTTRSAGRADRAERTARRRSDDVEPRRAARLPSSSSSR